MQVRYYNYFRYYSNSSNNYDRRATIKNAQATRVDERNDQDKIAETSLVV